MSTTSEQTAGKLGRGTKKVYEVKGIASFPFSIHVEAEDEEEAISFAQGMEIMDLLLGIDNGKYDEVRVKEIVEVEDAKPW